MKASEFITEGSSKELEYLQGFLSRYGLMKKLVAKANVRGGDALGTELASVRSSSTGIDIVISPAFWQTHDNLGQDTADFVFMHEIGHLVSSLVGMKTWVDALTSAGTDPWDSSTLPFGQPNMEEAFAEVFAVIYTNSKNDIQKLMTTHYDWLEVVQKMFSQAMRNA